MSTATTGLQIAVTGMTCASCSTRVERKLNKLPGVQASVNYATGVAQVESDGTTSLNVMIATVEGAGYGASKALDREEEAARALRTRLIICAVLATPVLLLTMVPALQFPTWQWTAFYLTTVVATWGAWPFHRAALINLRHGNATMDTLISIGVLAAYLWSVWALYWGGAGAIGYTMSFAQHFSHNDEAPHIYLEVAAVVPVFILSGRWFEARARRRSGAALRALLDLGAKSATVLVGADATGLGGVERLVPVGSLSVGDQFVVRPGEKVATDGVVTSGTSAIDASLLTGESIPVEVGPGSEVIGATINAGGRIVVCATRVGAETTLASMGRMVTAAQHGKAPVQRLADRLSTVFVPLVLLLSFTTLMVTWWVSGDQQSAFTSAVAVLVIACPCALGLAVPTALLVGTGRGAQLGVVIRGPQVLEDTRRVDTVVLDKTGTITAGVMKVTSVVAVSSVTRSHLLTITAAVEHAAPHPLARAIVASAIDDLALSGPDALPRVEHFHAEAGLGVIGRVNGVQVTAGRATWLLNEHGVDIASLTELAEALDRASSVGSTVVAVAFDGRPVGVIALSDTVRPTSASAVEQLRALGLRPILLTGNNATAAAAVGQSVGIDEVISDVLPSEKVAVVRHLQSEGRIVAMIGDGVNDAAALATADLGIAMGSGSDVAIEASDITLVRSDLTAAVDAIRLSRATLRTIKVNMIWAFGYNIAMIPLAVTGRMNPLLAGAAMAFSSIFVVSNSLRLRRFG